MEAECNPLEQAVPYALLKKLASERAAGGQCLPRRSTSAQARRPCRLMPIFGRRRYCSVLDQPVGDLRWNDLEPLLRRRVDHRCRPRRAGSSGFVAADDVAAGGSALDRWPKRDGDRSPDVAGGEPAAAGAADMADGRYAGMAGTAGCAADLASVARCHLGKRVARRFARHGADLDALKAHILRHTGQIPLFIEEVARQSHRPLEPSPVGCRGILGGAGNSSHRAGRHRVPHRSLAERGQGASAARFGGRTARVAALCWPP